MRIFDWVHRKFNPKQISKCQEHSSQGALLKGKDEGEKFRCLSFNKWQGEGLLSIGTFGADGIRSLPHQPHMEEDITLMEVEEFNKNLAEILGLEDVIKHDGKNRHNHFLLKEHSECISIPSKEDGKAESTTFPLEEFLEIPVNSNCNNNINNADEKKSKKRKTLGTILFSKKQQEVADKSIAKKPSGINKLQSCSSGKMPDCWGVGKILQPNKIKRPVSSSQVECAPQSRFSKLISKLNKSIQKGGGSRATKALQGERQGGQIDKGSGSIIAEDAAKSPRNVQQNQNQKEKEGLTSFSSSCCESYLYDDCMSDGSDDCDGYYTLSREFSLGREQEYWIKSNSHFVVLEL